jgi:hypothetical protein
LSGKHIQTVIAGASRSPSDFVMLCTFCKRRGLTPDCLLSAFFCRVGSAFACRVIRSTCLTNRLRALSLAALQPQVIKVPSALAPALLTERDLRTEAPGSRSRSKMAACESRLASKTNSEIGPA